MFRFLKRIGIVIGCGVALLLLLQFLLSNYGSNRTGVSLEIGEKPARAATVADVLALDLPTPTLTRVSFPTFSYRDAFPEATDEAEVVITKYDQAPMLANLDSMRPEWRHHYPGTLPPVAERLPRNPAVVRGPDGVGQYGGIWRRATAAIGDIDTKVGYETFVRHDPSGKLQPCLAYRWTVEDNNRVYTFYMRKGHRWSDGKPFTVQDILWVCNVNIGSGHWPSPPNWMQASDGTALLYRHDIPDWHRLASRILAEAAAADPSPGRALAERGGSDLVDLLRRVPANETPDKDLQYEIVEALNRCFRDPALFSPTAWECVDRTTELEALRQQGFSRLSAREMERVDLLMDRNDLFRRGTGAIDTLSRAEVTKLNLLLFRGAYTGFVDKAKLRRVKVEAVADENGDDTHIIRFTFPEPNAIFLDKTTTFMFYRGLFGMARHSIAQYHPLGSKVLNTIDVLDWTRFTAKLHEEGASGTNTPAARLWQLLGTTARETLVDDPPEAQRQEIVDAINRALEERGFFAPEAWRGVDFESEYRELTADGFSLLRRDRAGMNRANELLIREDLLRRVTEEGLDTLDADELYRLNLMMLRAALDDRSGHGLLARNREAALNVQAENHPRRYPSWSSLMRARGNYHPEFNQHTPTLRAWRIVSEKKEKVITCVRNPYYYRVDTEGNQLPYIDAFETTVETERANILLKMASGNVDFQVRDITFENYTFLKQHEKQGDYELRLWANDYCGEVTFFPGQAHKDPVLVRLNDDARFRHALSLALNRQEIIDVVFAGIGEPAQFCVPEGSPYYDARHKTMSIEYDPGRANRLLDDMGLDKRISDGTRLLWDGRPLILNIDTPSERPIAVVQMACEYWRRIGISARMKIRSGALMFRMGSMGLIDIGVHKEGGNYFGPLCAGGYAPTHPAECLQWGQWVAYLRSGGRQGWEPPDRMRQIDRLWNDVLSAPSQEAKLAAWQKLSHRTADDLPIIGLMTSPGKLVYVRNNFKNVPKLALAGWIAHEPGNCCPEAFFFEDGGE